jgi:hypothetical protein
MLADCFRRASDGRLVRSYSAQIARRQFYVSAVLVFVLVAAAFVLGTTVPFKPSATQPIRPVIGHLRVLEYPHFA